MVNEQAPVVVRRDIKIFAPPEVIWEWIRRVDLWADWHPEISSAWLIDDEAVEARLKWRKKLLGVKGRITAHRKGREWGWSGNCWKIRANQVFTLDGDFRSTRLSTVTTLEGPIARLTAPLLRRYAERWSEVWLGALKTRLESQHERGRAGKGGGPQIPLSDRLRAQADRERSRLGI